MQLTITNADGDRVWSQEVDGTFDLGTIKMLRVRGLINFYVLTFRWKGSALFFLAPNDTNLVDKCDFINKIAQALIYYFKQLG